MGGDPMKVLYLATTGAGDPTKASLPLHIAAGLGTILLFHVDDGTGRRAG